LLSFRRHFVATFRQPGRNLLWKCACCSADISAYCILCDSVKLGI